MNSIRAKVYLETSFVSYLVGKETTDVKISSDQAWTRKWWAEIAPECDVFVSDFVLAEARVGNAEQISKRLEFLKGINFVDYDGEKVEALARKLIGDDAFPPNAATDAYHAAVSAVSGMDYLLTWNCKHIANPIRLPMTLRIIRSEGYVCPQILTPANYFQNIGLEG